MQDVRVIVTDAGRNIWPDLTASQVLVTPDRCLMSAPLSDAVRAPHGGVFLGVVATLVDVATSDPIMAAASPDWAATQDLAVHGSTQLCEGPVVLDSRLVRAGKKAIVASADLYDAHGLVDLAEIKAALDSGSGRLTHAGRALATFARLPRHAAAEMAAYDPAQWVGEVRRGVIEGEVTGTVRERMGMAPAADGSEGIDLALTQYVANAIGTINGGAQAMLVEAAAEALAPGRIAIDLQMHYISQLRTGPARTVGFLVRETTDHSVVSVRLVDAGNEDQVMAHATVTLLAPS